MRIEALTGQPHASPRPQPDNAAGGSAAASFSDALKASRADSVPSVDFTCMTRQQMREWVNAQIRSGNMSLDDSRPFMAMTMQVPVGGAVDGAGAIEAGGPRCDFVQKVRDGIEGARSRNDQTTLTMLETALSIIQRQQRQGC